MASCTYSKSIIENDIKNIKNHLKIVESIIFQLKASEATAQGDQKQQFNLQINSLKEQKTQQENQISQLESKLQTIDSYTNSLPLPKFGNIDNYKPEEILILCQPFNGERTDDFQTFYKKLLSFVENRQLSEKATKDLLSGLLKGDAFELFHSLRTEPFQDILEHLQNRFGGTNKSIYYYLRELKTLTRNPNETLESVLSRGSFLIEKTKSLVPIDEQNARKNHIMLDLLLRLCSPAANKRIREEQIRSHRAGLVADYKTLVDIANFVESDNLGLTLDPSNIFVATPAIATTSNTRERRKSSPYRIPQSRTRSSSPVLDYQPEFSASPPLAAPSRAPSPPPSPPPNIDYHERPSRNFHNYQQNSFHHEQSSNYNNRPSHFEYSQNYRRFPRRNNFRYGYGNIGTSQLKNLIEKLTDIFNILNDHPDNRKT